MITVTAASMAKTRSPLACCGGVLGISAPNTEPSAISRKTPADSIFPIAFIRSSSAASDGVVSRHHRCRSVEMTMTIAATPRIAMIKRPTASNGATDSVAPQKRSATAAIRIKMNMPFPKLFDFFIVVTSVFRFAEIISQFNLKVNHFFQLTSSSFLPEVPLFHLL